MLSSKQWNNKASDIKLVYFYSGFFYCVFSDLPETVLVFLSFIEYKKKVLQYQEDIEQLEGFQTQEMSKIKHLVGKLFEFYFL